MNESELHSTPLYNLQGNSKDIIWGISPIDIIKPHLKKIVCLVELPNETFASSDGTNLVIWKTNKIITSFKMKAISLVYIPCCKQILAYCSDSTQLHLINNKDPYLVTVHKTLFSNKIITNMIYFPEKNVLVCSGQGIMIAQMKMDVLLMNLIQSPDFIDFENIKEIYTDEVFTSNRRPVPIYEYNRFLIWFGNSIFIHDLEGNVIQEISRITITNITNCTFFHNPDYLSISEENGTSSILQYDNTNVNVPARFNVTTATTIFTALLDKNFFIQVSLDCLLTLYCITTMKVIDTIQLAFQPQFVHICENMIIIQHELELVAYRLNVFTHTFMTTVSNAIHMQRVFSYKKEPIFYVFCENGSLMFINTKTGKKLFGAEAKYNTEKVESVLINRDALVDGESFVKAKKFKENIIFFFPNYKCFIVEEGNEKRSIKMKKVMHPLTDCDIDNYYGDFLNFEHNKIVLTVRIAATKMMTLEITGHFHFYDFEKCEEEGLVFNDLKDVLTAVTCFSMNIVVIASVKKLTIFDIEKRRIIHQENTPSYTSLMMLDEDTVICGAIDGLIETRTIPQLLVENQSEPRKSLSLKFVTNKTEELFSVPTSISQIDYNRQRKCILALSKDNVITLLTDECQLIIRLSFPFEIYSACFIDAQGTIALSAFDLIFKINWSFLFSKYINPVETALDDFDLRIKNTEPEEIIKENDDVRLTAEEIARMNKKFLLKTEPIPQSERKNTIFKRMISTVQKDTDFEELEVDDEAYKKNYFIESRNWMDYVYVPKPPKLPSDAEIIAMNSIRRRNPGDEYEDYITPSSSRRTVKSARSSKSFRTPRETPTFTKKGHRRLINSPKTPKIKEPKSPKNNEEKEEEENDSEIKFKNKKSHHFIRDNKNKIGKSQKSSGTTSRKSKKGKKKKNNQEQQETNVKSPKTPNSKSVRIKLSKEKTKEVSLPKEPQTITKSPRNEMRKRKSSFNPSPMPETKKENTDNNNNNHNDINNNDNTIKIHEGTDPIIEPTRVVTPIRSSTDDSFITLQSSSQFTEPEPDPPIGEVTKEEFEEYLSSHSVIFSDSNSSVQQQPQRSSRRRKRKLSPRLTNKERTPRQTIERTSKPTKEIISRQRNGRIQKQIETKSQILSKTEMTSSASSFSFTEQTEKPTNDYEFPRRTYSPSPTYKKQPLYSFTPTRRRRSITIRKVERDTSESPKSTILSSTTTPTNPPPSGEKSPLLRIMNFGPCDTVKLPPEKLVDERTKHMIRIAQAHNPQLKLHIQDSLSNIMKMIKEDTQSLKN